jgi:hypothetical protein
MDIARIKALERDPPHRIYLWDDRIVAAPSWRDNLVFYAISAGDLRPVKLSIPGLEEIVAIGTNGVVPLALGRRDKKVALVQKRSGKWSDIPIPADLAKAERPWLIPTTKGVAVLTPEQIFRFVDGVWTVTEMPPLPEVKEFIPEKWGRRQFLYGEQLFIAWAHGEFGGMLGEVDLGVPKPDLQIVEGSKEAGSDGLDRGPYAGIALDGEGTLWVGGGTFHLDSMSRALFRYDGKAWKTVVLGVLDKTEGGTISFPGEKTDIVDLFAGHEGKLYLLGGALGIFAYENDKLVPKINFDFYALDKSVEHESNPGIDPIRTCYPEALVVDEEQNYFVSTRYYEILCFLRHGDSYSLKQVILPLPKF